MVSSEGFEPSRLEGRRLSTDVVYQFRHEDSCCWWGASRPPPPRAPLRGGTGERRCVCVCFALLCAYCCVACAWLRSLSGRWVSGVGIEPTRVPCRGRQVARPSPEIVRLPRGNRTLTAGFGGPRRDPRCGRSSVATTRCRGRHPIRVAPPRRIERLRARFVVSPSAPPPGECPRALVGAERVCVAWSEGIEPSFTVRETAVLCR